MGTPAPRLRPEDVPRIQAERGGDTGYELVHGELVPVTPANARHGGIAARVTAELHVFLREQGGGRAYVEAGFVLRVPGDPARLRGPDVAFVSSATLEAVGGEPAEGFFEAAPDLAIEIESPSDRERDLQQRVRDYLDAGARLVWTLHPTARTAMVYRPDGTARLLRDHESLDAEDVLPGFRIVLSDLLG